MQANGWIEGQININVLLSFAFGLIFVSVMLAFAWYYPNPEPFAQWVFITVLALAAGGIGAVIPGILNVELPYVKASGALALFLVVFLMKPAIVSRVITFESPPFSPKSVVDSYLSKVDAGNVDAAWAELDPDSQKKYSLEQYRNIYTGARAPLGRATNRTEIGGNELQSPSGYPLGVYRIITFRTNFDSGKTYRESVSSRATDKTRWQVFEHSIDPQPLQ